MMKRNNASLSMGLLILVCVNLFSFPAWALSLTEVYALALENDPIFLAAVKEREGGEEHEKIGRADLLPKVIMSYQQSPKNWQHTEYPRYNLRGGKTTESQDRQYRSYSAAVVLTQPLIDFEIWARYKASQAHTLMSNERFRADFQQLAVRVVNAYVDVAYAQDQIDLVIRQKMAYEKQLELNKKLFTSGEGTLTDVVETQSRYSQAIADEIAAKDDLDAAIRNLQLIVGVSLPVDLPVQRLSNKKRFQILKLLPERYEAWEELALANNPLLSASRQEVKAAYHEVQRNRAGYLPRLELYASHSENESSSDNTIDQKYRTDTIGLRMSMNIYNGGATSAAVRQAAAHYGRTKYDLDAQAGEILNALRRNYNQYLNSEKRISAYEMAVESASLQVDATSKSVALGQRVNVDVLNAEQQLYTARRDLSQAKYNYIKAWIGLLSEAGELKGEHLDKVAKYFR
ncbi:TolC family outer membrane protein [Photorhabdus laumondii]|uniref:Outer membrane protein PrtD n=2 Tax=Photorhabdus laumondii subsp. laumondii TaxID=141679 RepID=Q7N8R0_PHOLL|nr:TolC family outer membrane protein [Photorhabdus laumondii]RAW73414.1 peptidase [Photorhabdus sp. S7-51]RAW75106.1 peptidase [Photorhabdus sp. S14-60]RAW79335.1 peptidase [Photorhabdus sp. S15-56]RAW83130.1 peptidase [Photorhabdus sp. S12-55]RAW83185.1 peptidase [Photorhabdus sp. S5P8-50]CAE12954.1 Outer membrane protein PrtD [Photorhabdus laumondii subsp. laumondii TTO1]